MWLARIELLNFKSYPSQVFTFPRPSGGKNLALVGGVNGYGKTTLLEALYVGLYGEEAFNHRALDSAGLTVKSYGHFLEKAFHGLAPEKGADRMETRIEFEREDTSALRVTRKWFFSRSGKYNDQRLIVETRAKTGQWMTRSEGLLPELLESHATPPWLAPFFFFDGEKIAGLADADRTGWIRKGLENLLGVRLVLELREQLTAYSTKKLRESGGVDEQRVGQLETALTGKKQQATKLAEELEQARAALAEAKAERDRLSQHMAGLAQGSDAKTVAVVAQQLNLAETEVENRRRALRALLSGPLPLQLVRAALYDSLGARLANEKCFEDWEQNKARMQPNWEKFQSIFFNSTWLKVICQLPGARDSLEKTLAEAWDGLHNPRPENCDGPVWHGYLQANERRKLEDMRARSRTSSTDLRLALDAHKDASAEHWRLKQDLIRLQGLDNEDQSQQIEALKAQLAEAQAKTDALLPDITRKENTLRTLESEIQNESATYERERKKLVEGHPERQAAAEAEKVVAMIDALLPALFELKLQALSAAVTRIFRAIHHKDQVARIEIDGDGHASFFSHDGALIELPKSSGESQLFVLSLVGALAEVTGYRVPLIVDTPLARLSEVHCDRLLDYWMSDPERQVILLAQDKEIGADDLPPLQKSLGKTYLLEHQQIKQGVGETRAIEDRYFEATA